MHSEPVPGGGVPPRGGAARVRLAALAPAVPGVAVGAGPELAARAAGRAGLAPALRGPHHLAALAHRQDRLAVPVMHTALYELFTEIREFSGEFQSCITRLGSIFPI